MDIVDRLDAALKRLTNMGSDQWSSNDVRDLTQMVAESRYTIVELQGRAEPVVQTPFPKRYGAPSCPNEFCGYRCGCCCHCDCQTPCPTPDEDGDCGCDAGCHGGHEPWDCGRWVTRYDWAKSKAAADLPVQGEPHRG